MRLFALAWKLIISKLKGQDSQSRLKQYHLFETKNIALAFFTHSFSINKQLVNCNL